MILKHCDRFGPPDLLCLVNYGRKRAGDPLLQDAILAKKLMQPRRCHGRCKKVPRTMNLHLFKLYRVICNRSISQMKANFSGVVIRVTYREVAITNSMMRGDLFSLKINCFLTLSLPSSSSFLQPPCLKQPIRDRVQMITEGKWVRVRPHQTKTTNLTKQPTQHEDFYVKLTGLFYFHYFLKYTKQFTAATR